MSSIQVPQDQIAEAAFYLWLEEGQPDGKAEEHWQRAKTALEARPTPKPRKPRAKTTTTKTTKPRASAKAATKPRAKAPAKPRTRSVKKTDS